MTEPEWYTSLGWVTQMAHLFSGWALVLSVDLFCRRWYVPPILLQLWAIPKEFLWDILVEKDSWEGGWLDWSMYTLGGLIASLILFWKRTPK